MFFHSINIVNAKYSYASATRAVATYGECDCVCVFII